MRLHRGSCRRALALLITAPVLLLPQAGAAGRKGEIIPPYSESFSDSYCSNGVGLSSCTHSATADHLSGALGADLRVTSPDPAPLPGDGYASGNGRIVAVGELRKEAFYVPVTVTLHIKSAEAIAPEGSVLGYGYGYADAWVNVALDGCGECYGGRYRSIVDADSYGSTPSSRSDEDLVFNLFLVNGNGGPVPPGQIRITTGFWASASMSFSQGTARTLVDATLSGITVG